VVVVVVVFVVVVVVERPDVAGGGGAGMLAVVVDAVLPFCGAACAVAARTIAAAAHRFLITVRSSFAV